MGTEFAKFVATLSNCMKATSRFFGGSMSVAGPAAAELSRRLIWFWASDTPILNHLPIGCGYGGASEVLVNVRGWSMLPR